MEILTTTDKCNGGGNWRIASRQLDIADFDAKYQVNKKITAATWILYHHP